MLNHFLPFSSSRTRRRILPALLGVQEIFAAFALFDNDSDASQKSQAVNTSTQTDRRIGVSGEGNITASDGSTVNVQSLDRDIALKAAELGATSVDLAVRASVQSAENAVASAQESARVASSVAVQALDANSGTLDTALRAGVAAAQSAIASAEEAARVASSVAVQNSAAAMDAAREAARVASAASLEAAREATASAQESARVASSAILAGQDRSLETVDRSISAVIQGQDRALDAAERSLDSSDRSVALAAGIASDATENARAIVLANNDLTETTRQQGQELVKLVADKLSTSVNDERQNINAELIGTAFKYASGAAAAIALAVGIAFAFRRKSA